MLVAPFATAQSDLENTARRALTSGETGNPYVTCYTQKEFKGAAQSWVFAEDDRGVLYVGNNIGVLEFDGTSWRRIGVGGGDVVRGLTKGQDGRIYVGTAGDFGYLTSDDAGETHFVSLLEYVDEALRDFNEIWAVHATDEGVYFLSRERLFLLKSVAVSGVDGQAGEWQVTAWEPEVRFLFSFWANGTYYVHQGGVGLMKMAGGSLELIPGGDEFADERLQVMLPLPDSRVGEFVVGSFNRGLFVYDGSEFRPFESNANAYLRATTLYKGATLADGSFALATLDGGLVIIDRDGALIRTLDLSLGLPSNSIISTFVDRDGGVWFSPETGICRVEVPSPLSYFDATNGLVGGVLGMVRHKGTLYVSASNGTFLLNARTSRFERVSGFAPGNPQSFTLLAAGDILLVATGTGVYRIDGDRATVLKENLGGSFASTSLHQSHLDESLIFVGLIDGLAVLRLDANGGVVFDARVPGVQKDIWTFAELEPGDLWLGTRTVGATRLHYSADPTDNPTEEIVGSEQGLPSGAALTFDIGGRLVALTKVGVYSFDEEAGQFARDDELDVIDFDGMQEDMWLAEAPNGNVWVGAGAEAAMVRRQTDGSFIAEPTPILRVADVTAAFIYPDSDGVVWFGGTESLLRYDPSVGKSYSSDYAALVRRITTQDDSLIFGGTQTALGQVVEPALGYRDNALRIEYSAVTFDRPSETRFRSTLEGFDDRWSSWTTDTWREYTNLPPGDYTFRVRAFNVYGHESTEGSYAFTIVPPWYRTWWAYAAYALLLGLLIFVADRAQRRRLAAKEHERAQLREAELRAESAESETKNVEVLSEIGRDITSRLTIEKIIDTVYENVNDLMDAPIFSIGILNETENRIEFPGSKEKGQTMPMFFYRLDDDRLATWCYHNRREIVIQDYDAEHQEYLKADQPPVSGETPESVLYMPLIHKERVIGVISTQSFAKNAYSGYHVNILRNLATYVSIALDNAEAYQRLNKTLEDLQTAQTRLVQSEKMASLGQLTAGIAHEIKNPLNFVNNFAAVSAELADELVEEIDKNLDKQLADVAEELREILSDLKINAEMINEHGKRADGIVKSMLQHSRGDSGERTATDVNVLLEEYVNLAYHGMRAADPDFNSSIEKNYDDAAGEIAIIPQDIGRVLINLLNNAFYAVNERAHSGEADYAPTVSVHTKRMKNGLEIGVRDNGTGIPDSVKAKIFEPFYTTKPTGSGTGLGLSMSYDIISKGHGGELRVDSKAGEFTHFIISLPG